MSGKWKHIRQTETFQVSGNMSGKQKLVRLFEICQANGHNSTSYIKTWHVKNSRNRIKLKHVIQQARKLRRRDINYLSNIILLFY